MDKSYLLFGGSGFIGFHLANLITEMNLGNPFVFDIRKPRTTQTVFENVDVRKPIATKTKISEDAIIFNLAAVHRTPGHPSNEYFETNLLGAENVCNYARENNINTIVFTSSIATYGTYEESKSEHTIPMPDIPYGISKLTAEYIHKLWQEEDPINRRLIIVRPGVVFGNFEEGNFTRLINSITKKKFFYPGRKDTIKACIYVKDLVLAMTQMSEKEPIGVNTYNMTYEPAPRINEICSHIAKEGMVKEPKLVLPSSILLFISKIAFNFLRIKSLHPDRVRKLMISNSIDGKKLNDKYKMKFGLKNGLADWMTSTNFLNSKKIF